MAIQMTVRRLFEAAFAVDGAWTPSTAKQG